MNMIVVVVNFNLEDSGLNHIEHTRIVCTIVRQVLSTEILLQ